MAQNPFMLAPDIPSELQKSILKLLPTFDRLFDRFLVPSWRQNRAQDRPRRTQDAPKTATWPQLAAQDGPRRRQDAPKTRPRRPLGTTLPPKSPPRRPQDAPKMATSPQLAAQGPNLLPKRPKTAPRCAQDEPKTASWPQLAENSRDLAKNCRDLAKNKAKNKDITHDCKRTPDIKAECCQTSSRPQSARTPKTWGGGAPP